MGWNEEREEERKRERENGEGRVGKVRGREEERKERG